jgi:hypothetical protein
MQRSNFALRLQPSLLAELKRLAKEEGVAVNQLINVAVAEKLSAMGTARFMIERAGGGDINRALSALARMGKSRPAREGDEPEAVGSRRPKRRAA